MNSSKTNIYVIILLALLVPGMTACQKDNSESSPVTDKPATKSDSSNVAGLLAAMNMHYFDEPIKAPEFELQSVKGSSVSLSQYKGNVVLLSFWATW